MLTVVFAENGEELGLSETAHGIVVALVYRWGHEPPFSADANDFLRLLCSEVREAEPPEGTGLMQGIDAFQRPLERETGIWTMQIVYINLWIFVSVFRRFAP